MRVAILLILGCVASAPACASVWSNLWHTPDQQGEALLTGGHPARAAERFRDPRLKAYADLEAGRYARAARLLAPFKDATSEYNRGNALARSGHLRAALTAYDAALKQDPGDKDIRHNRDLVARMLRQAPKPPAKSGGQGKPQRTPGGKRRGGGQTQNPNRQQGRGQQGSSGGMGAANAAQGGRSSPRASAGPGGARPAGSAGSRGARRGASTGASSGAGGAPQAGQQGAPTAPQSNAGSGQSRQSPGEARREAALAAALARRQGRPGGNASGRTPAAAARAGIAGSPGAHRAPPVRKSGVYGNGAKPVSEKTLALEQWLRQIPDNPAGLLRRKFLIDYMMKHPGENP